MPFKHALVQDAAYDMLLRARRQELHARVAAVLQQDFADIVERQPELLAHHLTAAGDTERAVDQWLKAGQHAAERLAHLEASVTVSRRLAGLNRLRPADASCNVSHGAVICGACPALKEGSGIMINHLRVAAALALGALGLATTTVRAGQAPPPWAYGFTTLVAPGTPPAESNPQQVLDNVTMHTLPGSNFSFTRAQIANRYGPADWFPEDHPPMPEIVAKGKEFAQPKVYACSLCHLPQRPWASRERQCHRPHLRIFRAADDGLPQRRA